MAISSDISTRYTQIRGLMAFCRLHQNSKIPDWDRAGSWSHFCARRRRHSRGAREVVGCGRAHRHCSARCEMRGARSNSAYGVSEHGADGPTRRSSSVSPALRSGPPPIRSPRATAGHDRMAQPPRRSSSRGTACGSGSGPGANARPRTSKPAAGEAPHDGGACSRVGWTSLLLTPDTARSASNIRAGR
jgi:hypothetical protein